MKGYEATRRAALRALSGFLAGSPLLPGQQDPFRDHSRVPRMDELETAFDFEPVAFARVPRTAYNYTAYGSETEFTLRRNREAFDWVSLLPGAKGAESPVTAVDVLGTKMAYPIMISPSAAQAALHPEGEPAMYQGATAAAQTPMIISNVSSFPVAKIAAAAKGPLWFQLYARPEMDYNRKTLEDAQAAGCRAIVVTIDQQASYFERSLHDRNLSAAPPRRTSARGAPANPYGVTETRLWYEWKLFDQLRPMVKLPIIAKGILTAEDAKLCLDHGLDGVYVSNHGGRSLDYAPSSLEVLPEIVDAVNGRVPVLFDSGVRRGTDVLKALALGARAVCLGRVPRWGLAAYGAPGVQRVLEIVQAEFVQAMKNAGVRDVASINRTLARTDFP